MCFSETSSFALAATIAPAGMYGIRKARQNSPQFVLMACVPVFFAIQQAIEGCVWHGINNENAELVFFAARGFVFFSHFFWLFFVPLASYAIETDARRKTAALLICLFGSVFGAVLYIPLLLHTDNLLVRLSQHSIDYETNLIFDGWVSRLTVHSFYAFVIVISLIASSNRSIRWFGVYVLTSVVVARLLFAHAFISVWCFFAAAMSVYLVFAMHRLPTVDQPRSDAKGASDSLNRP